MFNNRPSVMKRPTPFIMMGIVMVVLLSSFILGSLVRAAMSQPAREEQQDGGGAARVEPPHLLQDFTLMNHQGDLTSLSDLRGQPVLMLFGYTNCPDVCPTTLAKFRVVAEELGEEANDVAFVFVSVDAQRDTPEVVSQYLAQFSDQFIGLIGETEVLNQIAPDYGLMVEEEEPTDQDHHESHDEHDDHHDDYAVSHTSPAFLIDQDGYLRMVFFQGTSIQTMVDRVREVLALDASTLTEPSPETVTGNPEEGARLFSTFQPDAGIACSTCHLTDSDNRLIGPGLLNIAARAASRTEDQNAADYIRTSIIDPGAYVVDTYQDIMPKNWDTVFTEQQIDDVVAYLLTLGQ